ncbi:MAG: glycosyl hydrolase 53 family protein [Lachnospiraceae bacterium]|nr:glycosyl hydrolase 53 family protein [Lachnospiraceae bacterium]
MIKGMDISVLPELEELGAVYYDKTENGYVPKDYLTILKEYDFNSVRIRLWNDPYSEDGAPYGAGTNDLARTVKLAKRAKERGFSVLLDFHYSDFWADPGKQYKPKAWRDYDDAQLEKAVYAYTKEVLLKLREENALPDMVQVGNELSNGLLWPNGKTPNYDAVRRFVNAGIRGVREAAPHIPVMLHLDNGGNNALYREWFDHFTDGGEEFEYIGLSYYPFWHGTQKQLFDNMNDIAARYGKKLIIAEVSMGFTLEDYADHEKLAPSMRKGMAAKPALAEKLDYPMTKEGQCAFMRDLLEGISKVTDHACEGFYYWEGGWIPVPGSGWATPESLAYIQDPGPCGNEWANQAVFDYDGRILPVMDVIRDYRNGE